MGAAQPFGREHGFVYIAVPRPPEDDWIAIAAETFVALIESGPGERGVEALTELARSADAALEAIVSAIPAGPDGVDSFAVVHLDEPADDGWRVTAVARGRALVDLYSEGGSRRFSSSGVQPWLIATFRDVVAVGLGGPARRFDAVTHRNPSALAIGLGTAHAGSLLWSMDSIDRSDADATDGDVGYVRSAAALDDDTVRRSPLAGRSVRRADEPDGGQPGRADGPDGGRTAEPSDTAGVLDAEETVERHRIGDLAPFEDATDRPAPDALRREADELTVARASVARFFRPPVESDQGGSQGAGASSKPSSDGDAGSPEADGTAARRGRAEQATPRGRPTDRQERTVEPVELDRDDPASLDGEAAASKAKRSAPGELEPTAAMPQQSTHRLPGMSVGAPVSAASSPAAAPGRAPASVSNAPAEPSPVRVGVRGRDSVLLDAPIIVGRHPAGTSRHGIQPLLVTVPSPGQVVSASHLRIERQGSVVVVTDLRSRNGTSITVPGARPRRLRPGESFAVPGAATVEIGDGTIIEITPVAR
ncbi:FHA domain-containing protein [Rathayibacter sp. CAU 1779]